MDGAGNHGCEDGELLSDIVMTCTELVDRRGKKAMGKRKRRRGGDEESHGTGLASTQLRLPPCRKTETVTTSSLRSRPLVSAAAGQSLIADPPPSMTCSILVRISITPVAVLG